MLPDGLVLVFLRIMHRNFPAQPHMHLNPTHYWQWESMGLSPHFPLQQKPWPDYKWFWAELCTNDSIKAACFMNHQSQKWISVWSQAFKSCTCAQSRDFWVTNEVIIKALNTLSELTDNSKQWSRERFVLLRSPKQVEFQVQHRRFRTTFRKAIGTIMTHHKKWKKIINKTINALFW